MRKNEVPTKLWSRRVTAEQAQQLQAVLEGMKGSGHPSKPAGSAGAAGVAGKISTATPSGNSNVVGAATRIAYLEEQLALQAARADGLQVQLEEEQQANNRQALEIQQLLQMGGTERQGAYIARLQAKVAALGGNKSEFDQEAAGVVGGGS